MIFLLKEGIQSLRSVTAAWGWPSLSKEGPLLHSSQLFVQASKVATNYSVVRYCGNLLPSLPQNQVTKTGIRMRSLKGTSLYHEKKVYI